MKFHVPNTPAAEAKIHKAMHLVEAAQVILDHAAQELCPVVGLVQEWTTIGQLSDKAKAMWFKLDESLSPAQNSLRLDSEPKP